MWSHSRTEWEIHDFVTISAFVISIFCWTRFFNTLNISSRSVKPDKDSIFNLTQRVVNKIEQVRVELAWLLAKKKNVNMLQALKPCCGKWVKLDFSRTECETEVLSFLKFHGLKLLKAFWCSIVFAEYGLWSTYLIFFSCRATSTSPATSSSSSTITART